MANTLTGLSQTIYLGLDTVSRELIGMIPAVFKNSSAERAALNQSIVYPVTQPQTAIDITPAQYAPNAAQTVPNGSLTISKSRGIPITWNGEEQRGGLNAGWYNQVLQDQFAQAFRALANELETDLVNAGYQSASRAYGTAATTPIGTAGDLSDLSQTRKILDDNGAPQSELRFVANTATMANLRGKQSVLFKVNEAGNDDLLRRGIIAELEGFGMGTSNQLKQVTKGTGASYVTSGSTAVGVTDIALVTGSGTVLAGDVVTFAADTVDKYVVGAGVAAPGTISLNKPGAQVVIPTGNALTIGGNYTPNLAFHKMAIHMVTRVPAMPIGPDGKAMDMADDVMLVTDPISGITFQIAVYRQFQQLVYIVSLAWGVKGVKPAHIATLLG